MLNNKVDVQVEYRSKQYLCEKSAVKYFNKVAHLARVQHRFLRDQGYDVYKVDHYELDIDTDFNGEDIISWGTTVIFSTSSK